VSFGCQWSGLVEDEADVSDYPEGVLCESTERVDGGVKQKVGVYEQNDKNNTKTKGPSIINHLSGTAL
jgi:hypothetical protein